MVWALAQERPWEPALTDPFVDRSVAAAVRGEADVTAYELEDGRPSGQGVLGVVLDLRPGLDPEEVRAVATRWARGWRATVSCARGSTGRRSGCAEVGHGAPHRTSPSQANGSGAMVKVRIAPRGVDFGGCRVRW